MIDHNGNEREHKLCLEEIDYYLKIIADALNPNSISLWEDEEDNDEEEDDEDEIAWRGLYGAGRFAQNQ